MSRRRSSSAIKPNGAGPPQVRRCRRDRASISSAFELLDRPGPHRRSTSRIPTALGDPTSDGDGSSGDRAARPQTSWSTTPVAATRSIGATPPSGATTADDIDLEQELVFPSPVLVELRAAGLRDRRPRGLGAAPGSTRSNCWRSRSSGCRQRSTTPWPNTPTSSVADALARDDFRRSTARLLATGGLVRFDHDDPDSCQHSPRGPRACIDGLRRQAQVHQEFDRLEAEHDARRRPHGPSARSSASTPASRACRPRSA